MIEGLEREGFLLLPVAIPAGQQMVPVFAVATVATAAAAAAAAAVIVVVIAAAVIAFFGAAIVVVVIVVVVVVVAAAAVAIRGQGLGSAILKVNKGSQFLLLLL